MNEATLKTYLERMQNVFDYINDHLYDHLSVDELSQVAHFSKYHFHRQFSEYYGVSVIKYIQLMRLKRASYQLVFRHRYRIIDIAMNAGFDNAESFSRAFKKMFGQTPSQFRKKPQWDPWHEKFYFLDNERVQRMKKGTHNNQVNIVDFKETKVAVLEHLGPPERINDSVRKFIAWRKENQLSPQKSATYNLLYDDPALTDPEQFRMDICAAIKTDVKENTYGIITKVIPSGRCAVLRHIGANENIRESVSYLYGSWLPESGQELRDFPCFFHRVNLFPDVPEHEMITDIYLPLI